MPLQADNTRSPSSWKRQEDPPLDPLEGARPCPHLGFELLAARTETINFRCADGACLGHFVRAGLADTGCSEPFFTPPALKGGDS